MKVNEKKLKSLVSNVTYSILKEYYNGIDADRYDNFEIKLNELDEINQNLTQDEDLNELIMQMRNIIKQKKMRGL